MNSEYHAGTFIEIFIRYTVQIPMDSESCSHCEVTGSFMHLSALVAGHRNKSGHFDVGGNISYSTAQAGEE